MEPDPGYYFGESQYHSAHKKDEAGQATASGVYLVEAQAGHERMTRKIALVR